MAHECSCDHGSPMVLDVREMAPREPEIGTAEAPVGAEQTVGEVAHHRAGALEVMKEMGINHCCGAQLTLREQVQQGEGERGERSQERRHAFRLHRCTARYQSLPPGGGGGCVAFCFLPCTSRSSRAAAFSSSSA